MPAARTRRVTGRPPADGDLSAAGLGIADRVQWVPFQRSAISWVAICGELAPTAMQSDAVQQSNATIVAGKGAARLTATPPGRAAPVAAAAAPAARYRDRRPGDNRSEGDGQPRARRDDSQQP